MDSGCHFEESNTGDVDDRAPNLLLSILKCKHKIYVTSEIEQEYYDLFKRIKSGIYGDVLQNVAKYYVQFSQSKKVVRVEGGESNMRALPDESKIKDEDRKFARLAYHRNLILVTYDQPLKEALGERAKSPEEITSHELLE
ncbi:hypothetical protein L3N51_01647 [Metallosphaera sp. J1]|uniref:PIN domain-containing protein n=1 Tax=Metallosphaera javensis (ex Hofmann et al. 2022) TaxID=99938 RepID=UPI001EE079A2|nr:PIN domain-containing protein [Metallosphaera javensis (ex Hofmann et al. 2022)]MCG3109357.1 hypothetical protein [Metallosphaera javensis (ex Hofmann et al. 2022)]